MLGDDSVVCFHQSQSVGRLRGDSGGCRFRRAIGFRQFRVRRTDRSNCARTLGCAALAHSESAQRCADLESDRCMLRAWSSIGGSGETGHLSSDIDNRRKTEVTADRSSRDCESLEVVNDSWLVDVNLRRVPLP